MKSFAFALICFAFINASSAQLIPGFYDFLGHIGLPFTPSLFPAPSPGPSPVPSPSPATDELPRTLLPALYIKNAQLVDNNNNRVIIHGTNWFGFNNGQTSVDGLWAGGTNAATDFSTVIFQLKLLGFNAIRLPFTFSDLQKNVLDKRISCRVLTLEELYKRTRAKTRHPVPSGVSVTLSGNTCNTAMPNTGKTINRFIWTIEQCVRNGMYVVIDYHGMGMESTPRSPSDFVQQWTKVWNAIKASPNFNRELDRRIIIDIFNEPDSMGLKWAHMSQLYLGVMASTKYSLYMIEGTGQTPWNMNWGDGFVLDKAKIAKYNLDDPSVFFNNVGPFANKIIVSPHIYGPSITKSTEAWYGDKLYERLEASFGHFVGKYPILIGEFGINFADPKDAILMRDFSKWLRRRGITNWLQWNYAQNGADTSNIAINNWQDINWQVIDWLRANFGF